MSELTTKLRVLRRALEESELAAIRLRGVDWFSWVTCGGSNAVLLTADAGVGEVLVTAREAFVLCTRIEQQRLEIEEVPQSLAVLSYPWQEPMALEDLVREFAGSGRVASDRPKAGEMALPVDLINAKLRLLPEEIERYRSLAYEASQVITDTLSGAQPEWSERYLASRMMAALGANGIEPVLCSAAGERRATAYRHPMAKGEKLGQFAMAWVCARRHGLYANLTRFVYFRKPTQAERQRQQDVTMIEGVAWAASRKGAGLDEIYAAIARAYESCGWRDEIDCHHQGGLTGYQAREAIAKPSLTAKIEPVCALAWNPSVPGAKIEDTILLHHDDAIEVLTLDPRWPSIDYGGYRRPDLLVRP